MFFANISKWARGTIAALAVMVVGVVMAAPILRAQAPAAPSPTPQWQIDAGGKMAFDVASVKPSSGPPHTNVNLSGLDDSPPNGGYLSAAFPLSGYVLFAYKLSGDQLRLLQPQMPKWAATELFDVEARAAGNPTRDQMRLMMQALLADRFKLAVHFETRQLPVFALVLAKPGKTGPQLIPHTDDPPCASPPVPGSVPAPPADGWPPPVCGALMSRLVAGSVRWATRNLTMGEIASHLAGTSMGTVDRPVVDQTGLSGTFDAKMEFAPQRVPLLNGAPLPNFTPNEDGPTFLEALQEQLGLKLEPTTGPVDVLVIDHVEEPSPN
jgi:uncharacterized protein (TIGR03435 family)